MEHCTLGCPEHIQIGQIWKEVDARFERYIRVESINNSDRRVAIRRVIKEKRGWVDAPRSRTSSANRQRFNGKRGGYILHARAPQ